MTNQAINTIVNIFNNMVDNLNIVNITASILLYSIYVKCNVKPKLIDQMTMGGKSIRQVARQLHPNISDEKEIEIKANALLLCMNVLLNCTFENQMMEVLGDLD